MKNNVSFIEYLLRLVPELKSNYDEHLADNDTLLPHVFMGDVTRFAITEADKPRSQIVLVRLLDCLEEGLKGGGDEVEELIVVSFVENLVGETSALKRLRLLMRPNLKREVEAVCGQ